MPTQPKENLNPAISSHGYVAHCDVRGRSNTRYQANPTKKKAQNEGFESFWSATLTRTFTTVIQRISKSGARQSPRIPNATQQSQAGFVQLDPGKFQAT
jgi:hypothetical protein